MVFIKKLMKNRLAYELHREADAKARARGRGCVPSSTPKLREQLKPWAKSHCSVKKRPWLILVPRQGNQLIW